MTQKDELKDRLGRSPDLPDAISMLFSIYQPARSETSAAFMAYR
ncbi:MAG: hypothetical protein ACREX3_04950 [Gammaproteobacteria bacterium]